MIHTLLYLCACLILFGCYTGNQIDKSYSKLITQRTINGVTDSISGSVQIQENNIIIDDSYYSMNLKCKRGRQVGSECNTRRCVDIDRKAKVELVLCVNKVLVKVNDKYTCSSSSIGVVGLGKNNNIGIGFGDDDCVGNSGYSVLYKTYTPRDPYVVKDSYKDEAVTTNDEESTDTNQKDKYNSIGVVMIVILSIFVSGWLIVLVN